MKQETLEEDLAKTDNEKLLYQIAYNRGVLYGIKWQQEQDKNKYSIEDLNKHVVEFLEWREEYFEIYHGNKNRGLYYARNRYGSLYYNEDRHTALTRKYYNLDELLELFNKFKKK